MRRERAPGPIGLVLVLAAIATGCSTTPDRTEREESPAIDAVYEGEDHTSGENRVEQLRDGLRLDHTRGATDAYIPLREPDEVIAIYVYPTADGNREGRRRTSGHWQHSVVRWSDWYGTD